MSKEELREHAKTFENDYDVLLHFLHLMKKISVFSVTINSKSIESVKFTKMNSLTVNEMDKSLVKLSENIKAIDWKIRSLGKPIREAKERAKNYLQNKQKDLAKLMLSKKRKYEKMQMFYEINKQELETNLMMLHSMESNKSLKDVLETCAKATDLLKIDISEFDTTVGKLLEQKELNEEVRDVVEQMSDKELEEEADKELANMEREMAAESLVLPAVERKEKEKVKERELLFN